MAYSIVLVTVPDGGIGKKIAQFVLEQKLAACVNQLASVSSMYWWEGKIESSSEELLIIKTAKTRVPALIKAVKSLHPSKVPEVISIAIKEGNRDYLKWIGQSVGLVKTKSNSKSKKTRAKKQGIRDKKKFLKTQKNKPL